MFLYKKEVLREPTHKTSTKYVYSKYPVSMDREFNCSHHSELVSACLDSIARAYDHKAITSDGNDGGGFLELSEYGTPIFTQEGYHSYQSCSSSILPAFRDAIDKLNSPDYMLSEVQFYKADEQYQRLVNSRLFNLLCERFDRFRSTGLIFDNWGGQVVYSPANVAWMTVSNNRNIRIDMYTGNYDQDDGKKYYDNNNLIGASPEFRQLTAKEMSMLAIAIAERYPKEWKVVHKNYILNRPTKSLLGGLKNHYYLRFYLEPCYVAQKVKTDDRKTVQDIY